MIQPGTKELQATNLPSVIEPGPWPMNPECPASFVSGPMASEEIHHVRLEEGPHGRRGYFRYWAAGSFDAQTDDRVGHPQGFFYLHPSALDELDVLQERRTTHASGDPFPDFDSFPAVFSFMSRRDEAPEEAFFVPKMPNLSLSGAIQGFDLPISRLDSATNELAAQPTLASAPPLGLRPLGWPIAVVSPKLADRLAQFEKDIPGQGSVSDSTRSAVAEVVARLLVVSETVSATVSNDGMLSIAAVFPRAVRLYVEVERDGRTGAAVTREKRYAQDIPASTVADLTAEVILAAVGSI